MNLKYLKALYIAAANHVAKQDSNRKADFCLPLQDWVDDMSTYLKSIDRNHLVMVASFGYFGASSPASLIAENPTEMVVVQNQDTRLFPVAQICQGEDSSAIASLQNIDLSDMHIYPELWAFCDNRYSLTPSAWCISLSSTGTTP